jgi:hypothetical protein
MYPIDPIPSATRRCVSPGHHLAVIPPSGPAVGDTEQLMASAGSRFPSQTIPDRQFASRVATYQKSRLPQESIEADSGHQKYGPRFDCAPFRITVPAPLCVGSPGNAVGQLHGG